jgi:hypothetical protein
MKTVITNEALADTPSLAVRIPEGAIGIKPTAEGGPVHCFSNVRHHPSKFSTPLWEDLWVGKRKTC